jgi:hypothetical protein
MEKHVFFAVFMDHKKNIDFLGSSCIPPSKKRITLDVLTNHQEKNGFPTAIRALAPGKRPG